MTGIKLPNTHGFVIRAVKEMRWAEVARAWREISKDRHAISGMVSWPENGRCAENFYEIASMPGCDMNIVQSADGELLAYFWVSNIQGHSGYLHFNILTAGQPLAVDIGKYVLHILWRCGYQCLAGLTPKHLRNAVGYAREVGGVIINEWPGACYWADKDIWEPGVLSQFLPGCELRGNDA